jgi:hypothetical protein
MTDLFREMTLVKVAPSQVPKTPEGSEAMAFWKARHQTRGFFLFYDNGKAVCRAKADMFPASPHLFAHNLEDQMKKKVWTNEPRNAAILQHPEVEFAVVHYHVGDAETLFKKYVKERTWPWPRGLLLLRLRLRLLRPCATAAAAAAAATITNSPPRYQVLGDFPNACVAGSVQHQPSFHLECRDFYVKHRQDPDGGRAAMYGLFDRSVAIDDPDVVERHIQAGALARVSFPRQIIEWFGGL